MSSSGAPEVLTGTRAPRTVRLEQAREQTKSETRPIPKAEEGVSVYVARDRRYRVQITAPQSFYSPDGRRQSGGKMLVAQFEDGVFRNNHHDPKIRKLIDEELRKNPYFGEFGDSLAHYWLASSQQEKLRKASIANAMATLKSLPKEVVAQYIGELEQGTQADHELPSGDLGPSE